MSFGLIKGGLDCSDVVLDRGSSNRRTHGIANGHAEGPSKLLELHSQLLGRGDVGRVGRANEYPVPHIFGEKVSIALKERILAKSTINTLHSLAHSALIPTKPVGFFPTSRSPGKTRDLR